MTTHEKTNVTFSFYMWGTMCLEKANKVIYQTASRRICDCMTCLFFDTFCALMMSVNLSFSHVGHHKPVCNDYGECSMGGVGGTLFDAPVSDWIDCSNCSRATESISLIRFS